MPPHYRVGLHEDEVRALVWAEAPQQDPEDPVSRSEPGPLDAPPQDRELLPEGEVLQGQGGPAPQNGADEPENSRQNEHGHLPDLVTEQSRE